jgi:hypothetical protein
MKVYLCKLSKSNATAPYILVKAIRGRNKTQKGGKAKAVSSAAGAERGDSLMSELKSSDRQRRDEIAATRAGTSWGSAIYRRQYIWAGVDLGLRVA